MIVNVDFWNIVKKGDVGDKFTMTFDVDPPEFTFDNTVTAEFHARNIDDPTKKFSGVCDVDFALRKATYFIAVGNLTSTGNYLWEIEFTKGTVIQSYPKINQDDCLFTITDDLE